MRSGTHRGSPCSMTQRGRPSLPLVGSRRLLPCEGGRDGRRARPHVPADQLAGWPRAPTAWSRPSRGAGRAWRAAARPEGRRSARRRGSRAARSSAPTSAAASCRRGAGRCRRRPVPASGWSKMLSTSSVWTSEPSARLMTGGEPPPDEVLGLRSGRTPRSPAWTARGQRVGHEVEGRSGRRGIRGASPGAPRPRC